MKITFIGDIFPANEALFVGFGIKSQFEKHKGACWADAVCSVTKSSDAVIGNLESPLLLKQSACKDDFYGNYEMASFLKKCGINYLNIANNHILEHGVNGYNQTIDALNKEKIGIIGNKNEVIFIHSDNSTIAIAGFSSVGKNISNTFSVLNKKNIKDALQQMTEANADLKIFCFHWGDEYIHKPSVEQRKLAKSLIDMGADIIIGHHPHVIQPYEQYKKGHIFYSLGNFCFDNPFQSRQFSKGMGVTISYNSETKGIEQVDTFGVRLSLKKLVYKMPCSKFESYFDKIQKNYQEIKDAKDYDLKYKKELAKRHVIERILMKVSLLRLFIHINNEEKWILLKNIKRYYLK